MAATFPAQAEVGVRAPNWQKLNDFVCLAEFQGLAKIASKRLNGRSRTTGYHCVPSSPKNQPFRRKSSAACTVELRLVFASLGPKLGPTNFPFAPGNSVRHGCGMERDTQTR